MPICSGCLSLWWLTLGVQQAFLASVMSWPTKAHPKLALSRLFVPGPVANARITGIGLFLDRLVLEELSSTRVTQPATIRPLYLFTKA